MKRKIFCTIMIILSLFLLVACKTTGTEDTPKSIKNIVVQVIQGEKVTEFKISTEADTLRKALEEKNLISGEEGPYGLFIKKVNGVTAIDAKQQWWCITRGDEPIMTGVDQIEIADGELYKITLKEGY